MESFKTSFVKNDHVSDLRSSGKIIK